MISPSTQPSLLVRIRDERDHDSWSRFVEIYAPLVYGHYRKRGLQDADAADLTQDVMTKVASAIKEFEYQPQKGGFRRWLFTVAMNQLRNFKRGRRDGELGVGDLQTLKLLQDEPESCSEAQWEEDYERRLFRYAADQVRGDFHENTWCAFWQTAVAGCPANTVAARLEMTVAAVYLAKRRVLGRIKEQVRILQGECP